MSYAAISLSVNNPNATNYSYPATIEEMAVIAAPQGMYTEIGMVLTFSPRGSYYTKQKDTVEIVFTFDLPKEAIVNDSWLWMDDGSIVKAILIDKWKASLIYEGIVKRRRDPSILSKTGPTTYELRIFPCAGNSSRKVKINYLVPSTLQSNTATAPLPFNFLSASSNNPQSVQFIALTNSEFKSPVFADKMNITLTPFKYLDTIDAYKYVLSASKTGQPSILSYNLKFSNGIYFSQLIAGSDKFYQFAINPNEALDIVNPKKIMLLFDFDEIKSTFNRDDILANLKNEFLGKLNSRDSFNYIQTNFIIEPYSQNWLAGDASSINKAFTDIRSGPKTSYSNLTALLGAALTFLYTKQDTDVSILLVSDSDYLGSASVANDILTNLMSILKPTTRIFVADYLNKNALNYKIADRNYYGNEYLYTTMSKMTHGNYLGTQKNGISLESLCSQIMQSMNTDLESLDYTLNFTNGFSYARYGIGNYKSQLSSYSPMIQLGKFVGDLPLEVSINGFVKNQPFQKKITVTGDNCNLTYKDTKTEWTGSYIKFLEETKTQTNEVVAEIVDQSMNNRILSLYTAFLALEKPPSDTISKEEEKKDLTEVIDNNSLKEIQIVATPNPFVLNTEIIVKFPDGFESEKLKIEIFDIQGKLVKTLTYNYDNRGSFTFDWNGNDNTGKKLPSGAYLLVISNGADRVTYKIVKSS